MTGEDPPTAAYHGFRGFLPKNPKSLRALTSVPFRWYFAGQAVSASGTFVQQTALGWTILAITGSASQLGIVLASGGIPALVLGVFGGTIADRFDNRRLLVVTQSLYGVLAVALWLVAAFGHLNTAIIIGISVASGFVQVVDSPTRQAFVPQLVRSEDIGSAASLNGVLMNGSRVLGPALAGALIVSVGTTACFAVNAATYVVGLATLIRVRPTYPARRSETPGGVRQAVAYVSRHQQLYVPLAMVALVGLVVFNFNLVLPLLAKFTYHGNGGTYGLLSTLLSVGAVAGSLTVGAMGHPRRRTLVFSCFAFGVSLALTAVMPTVAGACLALLLTGFTGYVLITTASTSLQVHAAPEYRGRVMALWVLVFLGTTPIGNLAIGWLCGEAGPRSALWAGATSCLIAAAMASRVRTPADVDAQLVEG